MLISTVQVKRLRAICDLMEAGPSGPNKFDQALAANVCRDVARMLEEPSSKLSSEATKFAESLRPDWAEAG